jgi:hypothetical protein
MILREKAKKVIQPLAMKLIDKDIIRFTYLLRLMK